MAAPQDSNQTVKPVAQADITAALLEITGDLDKAQVLQDRLPAWWLSTDAATRDALQQAHEDSQRPHEAAARLLGRVKPLKVFCAERLKTFLSAKGHASLNVERDTLDVPRRYLELNASAGPVIEVIKTQKHSLLQAAMQNFEQALAEPGAGLRKEVFERAATPLNCDDAAAVSFSNLEVLTHVHEASIAIEGAQLSAEKLLHLSKGLFRLDRLERYAQSHSEAHPSADPLEVSLAFRKGLADLFYLPGQPRHMRFESLGQVAPHHLTAAADRLRTAELSPELLNYLVELPLWTRYLKKAYSTPFERLAAPFEARMQAVFERGETLTDGEYRSQMNVIVQARAQAESAEIRRRTMEMLKPGATAGCSVPLL